MVKKTKEKILAFWNSESGFVFISTAISMLIAHGFCFLNLMYSHDSLYFTVTAVTYKAEFGRWLYPIFFYLRSEATPWLIGMLSILYISLAVLLVAKALNFNKIQSLCVTLLFSTNVSLTALFCTYIFDADAYCAAILLSCFAAYAFIKFPKFINIIVSAISIFLCLAIYQTHICVTLGLFLMILICKSSEANTWREVLNVIFLGVKELATIIIAVVLYIPSMYIMANIYGVTLSLEYNGPGKISSLTPGAVIESIPEAYRLFSDAFLNVSNLNTSLIVIIHWILVLITAAAFAFYVYKKRRFLGSLLLIIPSLLLMPLALNAIYTVSFGTFHQLMIFAFCLWPLLPLILVNHASDQPSNCTGHCKFSKFTNQFVVTATLLCICLTSINNIVYANGAYTYKKLIYDSTALHAQSIWEDINNIDGYVEGETQIVFMGEFASSKAAYVSSLGDRYSDLIGTYNSAITYQATVELYFYDILGKNLNITCDDPAIQQNKEYQSMPSYPCVGYCKDIDGKIVVKLN